jgi:hypothetical protein
METTVFASYVQSPVSITAIQYVPSGDVGDVNLLGIYDNNNVTNYPSTLLASASVSVAVTINVTWVTIPISPIFISAPQTIWLGIGADPSSTGLSFGTCQNNPLTSPSACLPTFTGAEYLPNPWSWGSLAVGS